MHPDAWEQLREEIAKHPVVNATVTARIPTDRAVSSGVMRSACDGIYPVRKMPKEPNTMHVEFKNVATGNYYYLCGSEGDYHGTIWTPDIQEHLATISDVLTVGQLYELVRSTIDRLMEGSSDVWEMTVFFYSKGIVKSLTQSGVSILARYKIGDICYIDGVRQKTMFHPKYE